MGLLSETLVEIVRATMPPQGSDQKQLFWWRVRVAFIACTAFTGMMLSYPLALGWVPSAFPGFARSTDLRASIDEMHGHWAFENEGALIGLETDYCRANNEVMRNLYQEIIRRREQEYHALVGREYPLPPCESILFRQKPPE